MGNSYSALSTRKPGQSAQSSDVQRTSDIVANQRSDIPDVVQEETTDLGQPATGKRKSLLNFSSLRKRPKTTNATVDSDNEASGSADSSPSSRNRLWRSSLRGPRIRPTSLFVPSPSTIPARRPSSAILSAPAPKSAKEKGKERDENIGSSSIITPNSSSREDDQPAPVLDSGLPVAEEEMPLSEQVLLELRNLQTDAAAKNGDTMFEANDDAAMSGAGKSNNDVQITVRPPTPTSTGPAVHEATSSSMHLMDARMETDGQSPNEVTVLPNYSEPVESPPVGTPNICSYPPSIPAPPSIPLPDASTSEPNTTPNVRRPLPPTGTGTIVVVQGVVHTADVRQSQPLSQLNPLSHRPPRPASSTPALRNLFPSLSSRSSSRTRPTTPQSSSRRNRFSSFTETLRQRSSSRTPTSSQNRNNRNLSVDDDDDDIVDQNTGNHSVLSLGLDNPSDSETSISFTDTTSSVGAVVSTDDTSTMGSAFDPSVDLFSRPRDGRAMNASSNGSGRNNSNQPDDDADAELSPGSIEVLGTLLSVATAATAASLVNGTTEPLFQSGLTGTPSGNRLPDDSVLTGPSRSTRPTNVGGDRMRSAWDNLRDRFSRTRRRHSESDLPTEATEADDTREQMVREMARAFNLDLGGASAERGEAGPTPADPANSASNAEAPEGSFERFLHNLQVDLRTALAEDYAARRSRGRVDPQRPNTINEPSSTSDTSSPPLAEQPQTQQQTDSTADSQRASSPIRAYQPSPRSADIDLPPLPAAAESFNPNTREGRPQARAVTGQPGAGINWWRLYRFPPMVMAASSPATTDATSTSNPSTLQAQSTQPQAQPPITDTARSEDIQNPAESTGQGTQLPPPTQQQQQPSDGAQHVVPVIVVGLQSVPVNRTAVPSEDIQFPEAEHMTEATTEPTRGRPWPLRAASSASRAFGRMGRRNDDFSTEGQHNDNSAEPRERNAGRTYLIFVIGGYYPPNHGIVTGADDMNSFEALWELAELIGQAKPQVASKEDIEQSGLEILKASKLTDYETSHKVASNTIERCLICLDDYEPEDDVRLLSCRHAFHQKCVDKWLEQGRNNCPACRSKGVKTNDDLPVPS